MNYKKTNELLKYVGAGALIGVSGVAYLEIGGLVGALVFGLGLYLVIINKLTLYTGQIGYVNERNNLTTVFESLPFNLIGAAMIGMLYCNAYDYSGCLEILQRKLELSELQVYIRAIFCGMTMVCAVESALSSKREIGIFISVFIFVACGFEHCIADMFFAFACKEFPWKFFNFFVNVALGNTLGSLIMWKLIARNSSDRD